jgi:hypothetical protein
LHEKPFNFKPHFQRYKMESTEILFPLFTWCRSHLKEISLFFLLIWIASEFLFFLCVQFIIAPSLKRLSKPAPYTIDPVDLVFRIMDTIDKLESYSADKFIELFFLGSKVTEIRQDNFFSFLAWAMYAKHLQDVSQSEKDKIVFVLNEFCRRNNYKVEAGFNENVKHLNMTLQDVTF